jgi:hypothetical protein
MRAIVIEILLQGIVRAGTVTAVLRRSGKALAERYERLRVET